MGGESAIVPASASLVHKTPVSSNDTTLVAFQETNIGKGQRITRGFWSMEYGGGDGSGKERERERAQVVYMYVDVWE